MANREHFRYLPWALPAKEFLFDFVDMPWIFSHQPGLSYEVVKRFQLLLPGTLFFSPLPAILSNCGMAAHPRSPSLNPGRPSENPTGHKRPKADDEAARVQRLSSRG